MHGVQGPGGSRWGIVPGRGGSRTSGRNVYWRRRILVVLILLLLLALLVPRACQALRGTKEVTTPREGQKAGAPETATGAKGGTKDIGKTKGTASDRGVPFVKEKAGSKEKVGSREAAEESGKATPDLTAMVAEVAVIGGSETVAVEEAAGDSGSADESAQVPAGPSLAAAQQTAVEPHATPAETSGAPAQQTPSSTRRPPANPERHVSSAMPAAPPAGGQIGGRSVHVATVPVQAQPVAAQPVAAQPAEVPPVDVEPVAVEPVQAQPVAAEPVPAAPSPVPDDTAFAPGDTSVATRGVPTGFGGNAVGGAATGGAPFNRVDAALGGGPPRPVARPVKMPRSTVF
jgi:hypothetical protein